MMPLCAHALRSCDFRSEELCCLTLRVRSLNKFSEWVIFWFCFIDHSREERRWIERQNKAARQKLKKEEISRIRQLIG